MYKTALVLLVALTLQAQEDPQALFNAAAAKYAAADYRGAIAGYEQARKAGYPNGIQIDVRIARSHARLGEKDAAFADLKRATDAGFAQADLLNADDELLALRGDPRWATTIAAARRNAHPCAAPEFRQFDYWLGEWDVEVGGQKAARSSIQVILDDCAIFESYATANNAYAGKSFSLYDAATHKWRQRYVDTTGAFHEWDGGLEGDKMTFFWRHENRGGQKVLDRMTYTKEGPDKVRQKLETSGDEGKTWATTYDGLYTRRR